MSVVTICESSGSMDSMLAFRNGRTTFQRLSDACFFTGWVRQLSPDWVVVSTCTCSMPSPGDTFAFQLFGHGKDAYFHGRLHALKNSESFLFATERRTGTIEIATVDLGCEITSNVTLNQAFYQPRFSVQGVTVDIEEPLEYSGSGSAVIDLGPGGFAFLHPGQIGKGEEIDTLVNAFGQSVRCKAEVRSCVANALDPELHRVGVQIKGMTRVDVLRWKQIYSTILEANIASPDLLRKVEPGRVLRKTA